MYLPYSSEFHTPQTMRCSVCTRQWGGEQQQRERERKEVEKALNRQYFPHMENVGDILRPRSIWLGGCFIWKGCLSGRAWSYDLLKNCVKGITNMVGNLYIYVCMCLQLYVDENVCVLVTASLRQEGNDGTVRWWAISFPLCILWFLFFDILCGEVVKWGNINEDICKLGWVIIVKLTINPLIYEVLEFREKFHNHDFLKLNISSSDVLFF